MSKPHNPIVMTLAHRMSTLKVLPYGSVTTITWHAGLSRQAASQAVRNLGYRVDSRYGPRNKENHE